MTYRISTSTTYAPPSDATVTYCGGHRWFTDNAVAIREGEGPLPRPAYLSTAGWRFSWSTSGSHDLCRLLAQAALPHPVEVCVDRKLAPWIAARRWDITSDLRAVRVYNRAGAVVMLYAPARQGTVLRYDPTAAPPAPAPPLDLILRQAIVSRRLVWQDGMRATFYDGRTERYADGDGPWNSGDRWPDTSDPATVGVMLAMARNALNDPSWHPHNGHNGWVVRTPTTGVSDIGEYHSTYEAAVAWGLLHALGVVNETPQGELP